MPPPIWTEGPKQYRRGGSFGNVEPGKTLALWLAIAFLLLALCSI